MDPYDSSITTSSAASSSSSSSCAGAGKQPPPDPIDTLLAGAGYRVRSSDLRHVAHRLERLENVIVQNPSNLHHLATDAVHYNPSDLASWVDSLLSDDRTADTLPWMDDHRAPAPQGEIFPQQLTTKTATTTNNNVVVVMDEDSGIRLVHALMTCAELVQRGQFSLAGALIDDMLLLLARVGTGCGIGKVAGYFVDALSRRLFGPAAGPTGQTREDEMLYQHFYEACPYLKFAHFTANQAILEAFDGCDCVHVVDFNLMHGLQWPALIQALALRPGGPPLLRLTGIGPPSLDGRDSLREVGLRLAELARSVNVRFAFRGVAALRLEDVKPWMLQVGPREAVAVNSIMQLHRLLGADPARGGGLPIDAVLGWIRSLNPRIVTVVEQEANHNQPEFLGRFTEALHYYSTMFDSLETYLGHSDKVYAEMYIQREICNVLCCDGLARVERHEPLAKWRGRLGLAGFRPLHLGSNAFKQASMLLTLFSSEGYCVEENEGCLTLGWHSRPLIAASAWRAISEPNPPLNLISHHNHHHNNNML